VCLDCHTNCVPCRRARRRTPTRGQAPIGTAASAGRRPGLPAPGAGDRARNDSPHRPRAPRRSAPGVALRCGGAPRDGREPGESDPIDARPGRRLPRCACPRQPEDQASCRQPCSAARTCGPPRARRAGCIGRSTARAGRSRCSRTTAAIWSSSAHGCQPAALAPARARPTLQLPPRGLRRSCVTDALTAALCRSGRGGYPAGRQLLRGCRDLR
jgi:hypothetical protein